MTTALAPAPNGCRAGNGRFLPGNPGGPGSPYNRQVAHLRAALYEALSREDIWAVTRKMRDRALDGDVAAAKLLLAYTIGRPLPGTAPQALDDEFADQAAEEAAFLALTPDEQRTLITLLGKLHAKR